MKTLIIGLFCLSIFAAETIAQDKNGKAVKFSNITEATVGFHIGKTSRLAGVGGVESEIQVAGYEIPSPRLSSSFGAFVGQRFFIGPGFSYMYQSKDDNNPTQHHIGVFGHARLQLFKGLLRPYLELKGGYNHILPEGNAGIFSQETYTWDGAFAEPALGLGVKLGGHAQLNVSLGYQFMNAWNRADGITIGPEWKDAYHRLLLSLGFSFF